MRAFGAARTWVAGTSPSSHSRAWGEPAHPGAIVGAFLTPPVLVAAWGAAPRGVVPRAPPAPPPRLRTRTTSRSIPTLHPSPHRRLTPTLHLTLPLPRSHSQTHVQMQTQPRDPRAPCFHPVGVLPAVLVCGSLVARRPFRLLSPIHGGDDERRWTPPSYPAPKPKPASKSPRASGHGSGGKRRSPGSVLSLPLLWPARGRGGAGRGGVKPILIPPTPTLSLR
ncbi:hypothetical protein B0H13DRAFT_2377943 [Mycena leptocephala]|nr:hypothetical protein B0H13DRAFT_2377943 [Mycena leptocephala]